MGGKKQEMFAKQLFDYMLILRPRLMNCETIVFNRFYDLC